MLSPGWHITPISFQPVPSLMEKVVVFRQLLVIVLNHPTKCNWLFPLLVTLYTYVSISR